ncbi:MAG: flagellar basal body-associated FliL family protein [Chromatiaceae bacterium]|nr:flagellar basal body-associated FliL family protein [Chromatiaceae bacterium]
MAKKKTEAKEAPPSGKGKLILIILILVLLLAIGGGVAAYFLLMKDSGQDEEVSEEEVATEQSAEAGAASAPPATPASPAVAPGAPLTYQALQPLTVNLTSSGVMHFLRVGVTVTTYDPAVAAAIERHAPMIRNDFLRHLAIQDYEVLNTPEGKDALREELRSMLSALLVKVGEPSLIEGVLFTDLVMQ